MPTLDAHQSATSVKMLLLGESGSGKTGLLATLLPAGYRLFIADFDNGLDILRDPSVLDPKYYPQVFFKTFYDKATLTSAVRGPQPSAKGYGDFIASLSDWKEGTKSMGGIYSWGEKDVLVIDSLTFLGNMIFNHTMTLGGKLGQQPSQPDWGIAIDTQEAVIEALYNPAVKCNIVISAHLVSIVEATGGEKQFPSALGKKFPKKIGRYFNSSVLLRKVGEGAKVRRELVTTATINTDLKNSKPSVVPAIMEPDLGKLFQLLKGS